MMWALLALAAVILAIPLTMGLIMIAGMIIFMRNELVDSSNMFNWFRVVAFCAKHPQELLRMVYLNNLDAGSPFFYIAHDEYSKILKVRS